MTGTEIKIIINLASEQFKKATILDVRGREVLLAQAQKEVDLRDQQESLTLTYAAEDIVVTGCLDMSVDSFNGAELVDVDGVLRPVCDLDDDGVDNLGEACSGNDPSGGV